MLVRRKSKLTGQVHEMHLDITLEELDRWAKGELIQNVWPNLSPDEREFLISGITPTEWHQHFGKHATHAEGENETV